MDNQIFPLFAYPLVICGEKYSFSATEKQFVSRLEMSDNVGNSKSQNDHVLDCPELAGLKEFVEKKLYAYKKELLRIRDENSIYITQSWVNRALAGQFHPKHKHPNSIISGVLFVDGDDQSALPPIRFHRSYEMFPLEFRFEELNDFNASASEFDPVEGMLMLFPSLLEHDVGQNKSDCERRSVSFNTYVRGTIGGKDQLTEIEIS